MRNDVNRFVVNPQVDISRSKFSRNSSLKTSFNVGQLIPIYIDEVLPGDTFQVKTNLIARLQPLVTAPMDNLYLDTYYFFVPNRLVWKHWKEFMGENTESAWIPTTEYEVPQITSPAGGWNIGTIADYFGLPTGIENLSVSALPFRAYSLIVNEFFRDQNLQDPVDTPTDDTTIQGVNTGNYITDLAKGGLPFVAAKLHDYFTSALPGPQKGPDVTLYLGNYDESVPIQTKSTTYDATGPSMGFALTNRGADWVTSSNGLNFLASPSSTNIPSGASATATLDAVSAASKSTNFAIRPNNLYADISLSGAEVISINQLRMAFQIQKFYEKQARGGSRYQEFLKSHFGVTAPDARLQRPEYLGGKRIPININQVIQNSSTTDVTPQGNIAGMSLTGDSHGDFIKSFTEHGIVIGLCVARYEHTYQQGLNRYWSKKSLFDFYLPVLANIGEQPILNKEIYAQGTASDDEVFGYQEAWADYRYKPSIVTGEMRSNHNKSLDSWHFADDYESQPYLSASWIQEDLSPINRALAVTSSVSNQIFADFYIENDTTRAMPVYSIPGLIDHN